MSYGSQPDYFDNDEVQSGSETKHTSTHTSAGHRGLYSLDASGELEDRFEPGFDTEANIDPDYLLDDDEYPQTEAALYDLFTTDEELYAERGDRAIGYRNGHTYTHGSPGQHGHSTGHGRQHTTNNWTKWVPSARTDDLAQDLSPDDIGAVPEQSTADEPVPSHLDTYDLYEEMDPYGWSTDAAMDTSTLDGDGLDMDTDHLDPYQAHPEQFDQDQLDLDRDAVDVDAAEFVLDLDPRFQDAVAKMQAGAWPEVLTLLYGLQADYPQVSLLQSLINEAELKTNLVTEWDEKIKGRRLTVRQQYVLRKSLPYMLVFVLFIGGWAFYQTFIAPSRQVVAMARASEGMLEEAQTLLQAGRYDEATTIYNRILVIQPDNAAAQAGRADAAKLAKQGAHYRMAQEVAATGNIERALSLLREIQAESPNFRDAEAKIAEYEDLANAVAVFTQAEEAYQSQRWLDALDLYLQVQQIDSDYQRDVVDIRLPEVYLNSGLMLVKQRPQTNNSLVQAREYLRKGIAFDRDSANTAFARLDTYEEGVQAREDGDLNTAISRWRTLYDQEPHFLGGLLAEQLYYIYLVQGTDAAVRGDYTYAASLFEEATQLEVPDTSEAEKRLDIVSQV